MSPMVGPTKVPGMELESNNSMAQDISSKRGTFIGIVNSLLQEFHSSSPAVLMKLISSYALSIYGSSTWNLFSKDCDKLFNSWNVCVRNVFNVDRRTHRRLIEPISSSPHLKTLLLARQKDFNDRVVKSKKFEVRFIANLNKSDNRTVMGASLGSLSLLCGTGNVLQVRSNVIKATLQFQPPDVSQLWQEDIIKELLAWREKEVIVEGFNAKELEEILQHVSISLRNLICQHIYTFTLLKAYEI